MQKKILTTIVVFIISIFISVTSVSAATRLVFSENSNGNVKATLHSEDGFIGGLDITLKYSGDINLKQFILDSKLKDVGPVDESKKIQIKDDKTIKIYLTTGGVGTSHNLLNKNKELVLGDILFDTSSKSDVSYTIECTSLTVVGNDWNSKKVEPELENNKLTFKVNSSTEDKDNDKDDNKDDDKDNNQSSGDNNGSSNNGSSGNNSSSGSSSGSSSNNNSNSGNSGNNTNNNNNNSSSGNSNNQSTNDNQNSSSESNSSNSGNNSSSENNNTTNDNDEETDGNEQTNNSTEDNDEESKSTKIVEIILGIALVGIAGTICFLAIKPKKVKTDK